MRSDIKLNDHWSGVIRIQLPELKSATPTMGRVIELAHFEYKHSDQFSIRGGQFKEPFELDELTSHKDLRMVDRRPTSRMFVNNNYSSYNPGPVVERAQTCIACHGGNGSQLTSNLYPSLSGQSEAYLTKQIMAFKNADRKDPTMSAMTKDLTDKEIKELAAYFASAKSPEAAESGAGSS